MDNIDNPFVVKSGKLIVELDMFNEIYNQIGIAESFTLSLED